MIFSSIRQACQSSLNLDTTIGFKCCFLNMQTDGREELGLHQQPYSTATFLFGFQSFFWGGIGTLRTLGESHVSRLGHRLCFLSFACRSWAWKRSSRPMRPRATRSCLPRLRPKLCCLRRCSPRCSPRSTSAPNKWLAQLRNIQWLAQLLSKPKCSKQIHHSFKWSQRYL